MKITDVKTKIYKWDLPQPITNGLHTYSTVSLNIIEIHTDEGITGVGEVTGGQHVDDLDVFLLSSVPLLLGEDPFEIEKFLDRFYRHQKLTRHLPFANNLSCGIEMAMWDIIGKATNQPVHRLLGGKFNKRINFFGFAQGREIEEISEHAYKLYQEGFNIIYYKIGYNDVEDLAITKALREKLGENAVLRPDVNELYTVGDAKKLIMNLAEYILTLLLPFNFSIEESN